MTTLLQRASAEVETLSDQEQDAIGTIMEDLADEKRVSPKTARGVPEKLLG